MRQGQITNLSPICPYCGTKLDGWTHDADAEPKAGDFTICLYCSGLGVFFRSVAGLLIRRATPTEQTEAQGHPDLVKALCVAHIYAVIRGRE
jgi:hypothetical protein